MDHGAWWQEEKLFYQNLVQNPSAPHKHSVACEKILAQVTTPCDFCGNSAGVGSKTRKVEDKFFCSGECLAAFFDRMATSG